MQNSNEIFSEIPRSPLQSQNKSHHLSQTVGQPSAIAADSPRHQTNAMKRLPSTSSRNSAWKHTQQEKQWDMKELNPGIELKSGAMLSTSLWDTNFKQHSNRLCCEPTQKATATAKQRNYASNTDTISAYPHGQTPCLIHMALHVSTRIAIHK